MRWKWLLPIAAVVLVLGVTATDWPIGWSFWVDHPLVAAVVGGVVLLVLAGTALDTYVNHRERKRWHQIAWAASSDFALVFEDGWLTMLRLVGVDAISDSTTQMSCAPAYDLAVSRYGAVAGMGSSFDRVTVGQPPDLPDAFLRTRVADLSLEKAWLDGAMMAIRRTLRRHSEAVGRWAGTTSLLRDEEFTRAVTSSTPTIDQLVIVMNLLDEAYPPRARDVTSELSDAWIGLHRALSRERQVWLRRVVADAGDSRTSLAIQRGGLSLSD